MTQQTSSPDTDDETRFVVIDDLPGSPGFLTIGDVARQFGVTVRTLRYYETRQLLLPERRGQLRLYGRTDCTILSVVLKAKRLGLTLTEIETLVAEAGRDALSMDHLPLTRAQCEDHLRKLIGRRDRIDWAIQEFELMLQATSSRHEDNGEEDAKTGAARQD